MASIEIPDNPFTFACNWNIDSGNTWLVQAEAWGHLIFEVDIPCDASGPGSALLEGQRIFAERFRKLMAAP